MKQDEEGYWYYPREFLDGSSKEFMDELMNRHSNKLAMWLEMKKQYTEAVAALSNGRSSSEQSSQDCGYSSEHNVSSSSLPSTPEGSEVACNDSCCNREVDCQDSRPSDKLAHSSSSISLLSERGGGLTLMQMLEVSGKI